MYIVARSLGCVNATSVVQPCVLLCVRVVQALPFGRDCSIRQKF